MSTLQLYKGIFFLIYLSFFFEEFSLGHLLSIENEIPCVDVGDSSSH